MPDVKGMKPMEAVITILKKDGWLPAAPMQDAKLAAAFNDAAQKTKQATLERMNKSTGMAGLPPAGKVREEILKGFEGSIAKAEGKIPAAPDAEEKARLQASMAVMAHYRDVVRELKF